MISLTPFSPDQDQQRRSSAEIALYLGRAEQEAIAVLRATDDRAAASHCTMARHYSQKAVALLEAKAA